MTGTAFKLIGGTELAKFVTASNFVDVIQGPIGSGKSVGWCLRVMRHAQEQAPSPIDGLRKTRWAIVRNCYDDETELLTERRGWVLFKDLMEGERVAQLRDGQLEFVEPTYYYQAPYVGEMVGFENEGVDFRVTPEHRMWVSKLRTRQREWGDYEFALARDIYGNGDYRVRRDAEWQGGDQGRSLAFCEWFGFWFAEGSAGIYPCGDGFTRAQCVVTQKKPATVAYARALFAAADLPMTEAARPDGGVTLRLRTSAATRALIEELAALGTSLTKRAPQWLKDSTPEHIRAFLRGFIAGDGHVNKRGVTVAFTSSPGLADDLQDLALRAGMVANIASRDRVGMAIAINGNATAPTAREYVVTFVRPAKHQPRLKRQGYAGRYRGWYRERYAGTVYCIEVPTHVIYVRRNGKAFWSSQTYPDLKRTTIRTWIDTFPEGLYGRFTHGMSPMHRIRFPWPGGDVSMECDFLALDKPEDIRKLRSGEYTGIVPNELQFLDKEIFDEMTSRVGRYPKMADGGPTWSGVFGDANAPDEDHWLGMMTGQVDLPPNLTDEERAGYVWPSDWGFYMQPSALIEVTDQHGRVVDYRVNPVAENIENLPPDYYERQRKGKTKAWIDSRLMNRIALVVEGSPVWPMFRTEVHVSSEVLRPNLAYEVVVGVDFGRQPAAIFKQAINNRVLVQHELVGHNEGTETFAPKVKRLLAEKYPNCKYRIYGDPKGQDKTQNDERTAYDIYRANGLQISAPPGLKQNMISTRVDAVAHVLNEMTDGRPRFVLSPLCRTLKVAMAGRYHNTRDETGELKPNKDRYSNPADALQYGILGLGEGRKMIGLTAADRQKPVVYHKRRGSRRRVA